MLDNNRELLESALNTLQDIFIVFNLDGRLVRWNRSGNEVTGYSDDEAALMNISQFFPASDFERVSKTIVMGLESGWASVEMDLLCKDGRSISYEFYGMPLRDEGGNAVAVTAIGRDISERRRLIEKEKEAAAATAGRLEAERYSRELQDLITVAAHELRHPATVFKGYSYILLENADRLDSEVARDALRSIDRASDRIARIANELMDASAIEHGELSLALEEVKPFALLNRVKSEFKAQGVRISISDQTEEGGVFVADREKLRVVLANLVENAVKFSPADPAVDVSAETVTGGVLFSVLDRGPGIPVEHRELVFERFYQVQDVLHHSTPGLGLGLFITRTLVEAHGGWIRYRYREEGGSIFEFFIPGSVAK